jgi:hypothetical protein
MNYIWKIINILLLLSIIFISSMIFMNLDMIRIDLEKFIEIKPTIDTIYENSVRNI